jgi:hypothetical protein
MVKKFTTISNGVKLNGALARHHRTRDASFPRLLLACIAAPEHAAAARAGMQRCFAPRRSPLRNY